MMPFLTSLLVATLMTTGAHALSYIETEQQQQQQQSHREAYMVPPPPTTDDVSEGRRVWVTYRNGQHDKALQAFGAISSSSSSSSSQRLRKGVLGGIKMHYDFHSSRSFVITATEEQIADLRLNPDIEFVEDDAKRYPMHMPETVRRLQFAPPTGQKTPYGIPMVRADKAWDVGVTGDGVKVCVLDTGIDESHEDFSSTRLQGLDTASYDWGRDGVGHGTHVSGTIGAANNDMGVVGVAPDSEIYTIKVFGDQGEFAYASGLVDAAYRCKDAGANIVSMSLGGPLPSFSEFRAYERLFDEGVLTIAAAGNNGSGRKSFPASYQGVLSVGAVDENKQVASFSQKNDRVDISAPGVDVLSTLPMDGDCSICQDLGRVKAYGTISGTSMATPHVSGVAALLWSFKPTAGAEEIQEALLSSAEDLGNTGRDDIFGYGLVDALAALEVLNGGPFSGVGDSDSDSGGRPSFPFPNEPQEPNEPPTSQCGEGEILFELLLDTDFNSDETYWQVARETDGFPVVAGAGLENGMTYDVERCLPLSCYKFTILDSGDNGICCGNGRGSYSVTVNGEVAGSGSDFTSFEEVTFGDCSS